MRGARTFRKIPKLLSKGSLATSNPMVRRYLMRSTAVGRVLPLQKGRICLTSAIAIRSASPQETP